MIKSLIYFVNICYKVPFTLKGEQRSSKKYFARSSETNMQDPPKYGQCYMFCLFLHCVALLFSLFSRH